MAPHIVLVAPSPPAWSRLVSHEHTAKEDHNLPPTTGRVFVIHQKHIATLPAVPIALIYIQCHNHKYNK